MYIKKNSTSKYTYKIFPFFLGGGGGGPPPPLGMYVHIFTVMFFFRCAFTFTIHLSTLGVHTHGQLFFLFFVIDCYILLQMDDVSSIPF